MKAIIPILFVLACTPDIEPQKPNEKPICLFGIKKSDLYDDNGNLNPQEFITCQTQIDPYGYPDWAYFRWEENCEKCN